MDDSLTGISRRSKWLLGLLTPCVLVLGGGVWLTSTTSGLQWVTGVIENNTGNLFSARGISGNLRDVFAMKNITLHGAGWRVELSDVQMQWQPSRLLLGQVSVLSLSVREVDILTTPSGKPSALPDTIQLPIAVNVLKLSIGTLRMFSQQGAAPDFVASEIEMRFASDAQRHSLLLQHARSPYGEVAGAAEIGLTKPYPVKATTTLDAPLQLIDRMETLHFSADANGDLQSLALKMLGAGSGLSLTATARLTPFAETNLQALHVDFSGADADWLFADGRKALLSGTADVQGKKGGVLEGGMKLRNESAALPYDQKGLPLRAVSADLRLTAGQFQIEKFEARLAGEGQVSGALIWRLRSGKGSAQLRLQDVDTALLDSRLPGTHLRGDITADGTGTAQHVVLALTDGKLQLDSELSHQGELIEVSSLRLTRGDTELTGQGRLALDRRRTYNFSSHLAKLDLAEYSQSPRTDLNAKLEVSGTLLPQAAGELHFELADSHFAQYDIGGKGHLSFNGTRQIATEIEAHLGDNRLDLAAAYGSSADFLRLLLDAPKLDQLGNGLAGQLKGQAQFAGTAQDPRLNFSLSGKKLDLPAGQHIEKVDATGDMQESALKLQIGMVGYRAAGAFNIPQAALELEGSRAQHRIAVTARAAQGDEVLGDLFLNASGGFNESWRDWGSLQWQGALDKLEASGIVPLQLLAPAPLQVDKDTIHLGETQLALGDGQVKLSEALWTPQRWHCAGNFSSIGVNAVKLSKKIPLLERMDTMRFGGVWDVAGNDHLQGEMEVQRESGDWKLDEQSGTQLGLHKLQLSLKTERDILSTRFEADGERLGEILAVANFPLSRSNSGWTVLPDAPLSGHVHLDAKDFSWVGPLLDDSLQSGGALIVDADIEGSLLVPRLQGVALGDGLSLALLEQGIRLEQGKLYLRFDRDVIHVEQLSFTAPYLDKPKDKRLEEYRLPGAAGYLYASGMLDLRGLSGNLQITAEHLPLSQREDRWVIASGAGQIRFADKILMLDGHISADAGLIDQPVNDRPRWSDDLNIVGQETEVRSARQSKVTASLDLGELFFIRASGLEGRLEGTLDVRGEPGQALSVTGIIEAQDAIFDAYGQRLQVERGMVNFQGQFDDPGLNILALRKGLSVEAGVEVGGTARHPVIQLVSTPNVPDAEKLSWIVLGRVPDSAGLDTSLLLAAAGNILGGQSTGQIGRSLGVDELSMHQSGSSNGTGDALQSQVVTVGKRLTARAYLSYEHGFADPAGVTKFSYILTPRVTLVTRTGTEDAMDIFYSFRFH